MKHTLTLCLQFLFLFSFAQENNHRAIIPLPKELRWNHDTFNVVDCKTIFLSSPSLKSDMQSALLPAWEDMKIKIGAPLASDKHYIFISLDEVNAPYHRDEAYTLTVTAEAVILKANTRHGVFDGLQTLKQLTENGLIAGCLINDYPAFSWRGYMVDVGRNFQSLDQLKQQIDVMARYKMNIFHFHLTENVAWRLAIKKYPELTMPQNMTRNKGQYYSIRQMLDLIDYCKQRYITLVPEIDMPGHSQAFTRAMGFDMQSEKGLHVIKNILKEVCATYPVPYIHIGADEVAITNKRFIPEVERIIDSSHKKVIAWSPGASQHAKTIQQLWKTGNDRFHMDTESAYIDSRFLYISDMDPENTVVTIFNRRFLGEDHGQNNMLGAEICLWSDRRVNHEKDLLLDNAVYPAITAFAERSWRGGGYPGFNYFIGEEGTARFFDFLDFEKRLLAHKRRYFTKLPFTYVKQTHMQWKLFGPFENHGHLQQSFWPEDKGVSWQDSAAAIQATGGTIWLWQTHYPIASAWLPHPQKQTTWYAYTRFWSNHTDTVDFFIDTKDQSKSGADATPPKGEWDYNQSKLWINGNLVSPPDYKHAGRKSGHLEDPLVDEMYYIRPPFRIKTNKGWNTILVKLPVNQFEPLKNWQEPPKLMFTAIPVKRDVHGMNWEAMDFKFL